MPASRGQYDAIGLESRSNTSYPLTFQGIVFENAKSIKTLGFTIASDLRWNTHMGNICTSVKRTLGLLRRNLSQRVPLISNKELKKVPVFFYHEL